MQTFTFSNFVSFVRANKNKKFIYVNPTIDCGPCGCVFLEFFKTKFPDIKVVHDAHIDGKFVVEAVSKTSQKLGEFNSFPKGFDLRMVHNCDERNTSEVFGHEILDNLYKFGYLKKRTNPYMKWLNETE